MPLIDDISIVPIIDKILEEKMHVFIHILLLQLLQSDIECLIDPQNSIADILDAFDVVLIDVAGQEHSASYFVVLAVDVHLVSLVAAQEVGDSVEG